MSDEQETICLLNLEREHRAICAMRDASYAKWDDFPRNLSGKEFRLELERRLNLTIPNDLASNMYASIKHLLEVSDSNFANVCSNQYNNSINQNGAMQMFKDMKPIDDSTPNYEEVNKPALDNIEEFRIIAEKLIERLIEKPEKLFAHSTDGSSADRVLAILAHEAGYEYKRVYGEDDKIKIVKYTKPDELGNRAREAARYIYESSGAYIVSSWCVDDIHGCCSDNKRPWLSDEQAKEVLANVVHNHDASIGINWDTVDYHLSEFIEENNIKHGDNPKPLEYLDDYVPDEDEE